LTTIAYPSGSTYPGSGSYPGSIGSTDEGGSLNWIPDLREVALHIRNRTVERATNQFLGTFTTQTRPSSAEAEEVIEFAVDDVAADVGDPSDPRISVTGQKAIRALIALRAAMIIERSYYGEQIGTNKSSYPALERDWERRLPKVVDAIAEDLADEIEPTPEGDGSTGGTDTPTVDRDLVVPSGSRVLSKAGTWVGTGTATFTPGPEDPGEIDYGTKF
jgi:hypothetical protein